MRRLTVEVDASEYAKVTGDAQIEQVESLEVLHFIKQEPEEFSVICELKLKDPAATLEEVIFEPGSELQVLDCDRHGKYTVFAKSRPQEFDQAREFWASGGYMISPLRIRNGKVTATFLGNARQIGVLLGIIEEIGLRCKVQQFGNVKALAASPLGSLTERQREVLGTAFRAGYYDLPRKVGSRQLAARLNIGSSDLIKHRRKAERRVLAELFGRGAELNTPSSSRTSTPTGRPRASSSARAPGARRRPPSSS